MYCYDSFYGVSQSQGHFWIFFSEMKKKCASAWKGEILDLLCENMHDCFLLSIVDMTLGKVGVERKSRGHEMSRSKKVEFMESQTLLLFSFLSNGESGICNGKEIIHVHVHTHTPGKG